MEVEQNSKQENGTNGFCKKKTSEFVPKIRKLKTIARGDGKRFSMEFYRSSTVGNALIQTLNELISNNEVTSEDAEKVLVWIFSGWGFLFLNFNSGNF